MLLEFLISMLLVAATVLTHYEVLRITSLLVERTTRIPSRARILIVIFNTFIAHTIEVSYFAFSYYLLIEIFELTHVVGVFSGSFYDYLYFSISSYTSLGVGDIYLQGRLRFLSGVEALIGLMMITWSASFTYLTMEKFWGLRGPGRKKRHLPYVENEEHHSNGKE